jgi:RND family efflux transporter MFP subunit
MRKQLALLALAVVACREQHDQIPNVTPVKMEVLKRTEFAPSLLLAGVVRAAQTIPLTATQRGTLVLAPRFRDGLRTGESISKGELIAEVRNDQVAFSKTQARLQMEAAEKDHERMERSYREGVVSLAEYTSSDLRARLARETYAAMQRDVANLRILAPSSGRLVVAKPFASGSIIEAGSVLAEIATEGLPLVESAVAASERALLRPGLNVQLTGPGGWTGRATITEVASVIDAAGTARVVAGGVQASGLPLPGTPLELRVELDRRPDVLTVPDDAIVAGSEGPAVYIAAIGADVMERGYRVKRVDVATGGRASGRVEVTSGVRDGDRVIVSGADALSEDALVSEVKQ